MTRRLALVALLLALGLAAGCSGDGENGGEAQEPTPTETGTTTTTPRFELGPPPPTRPTEALERFLEAIQLGDGIVAWSLVSQRTKVTFELDRAHFVDVLMPALKQQLKPDRKILFDKNVAEGRRLFVVESLSPESPFAAPLLAEDGGWRLELFYPEFNPTRPIPGEVVAAGRAEISLDVIRRLDQDLDLQLWLDGRPVELRLTTEGNFLNTYAGTIQARPGTHLLVAYAKTDEELGGGFAWTFRGR